MDKNEWTPADLLQLSGGYWSACALHAGVKLDIFTPLSERSLSAPELALILKTDPRSLAMLLNALTSLGLLSKSMEIYAATPFAARFLARTSQQYLGYIIQHHHHLMASWAHLDEAVVIGQPIRERVSHADDETTRESFEMGMFNLAMQLAPLIVPNVNLSGRRRLLDLGGGPGTYAINFCRQNPELSAVVYDLPSTRSFAESTIARFDLTERIDFEEGDFITGKIEGRFDVAWLSHILHGEGPDGCAILLKSAVSALEPGGLILVQEFILDDTMDGPLFPALFSLNMLLGTTNGQAYSQGDLMKMLEAARVSDLQRLSLDLPNGAGIISGILQASGSEQKVDG
jgi:SAM-dependent methyltransferase